jgi:hypothetical protein
MKKKELIKSGVFKRGVSPSSFSSPSPFKERGTQGVRFITTV